MPETSLFQRFKACVHDCLDRDGGGPLAGRLAPGAGHRIAIGIRSVGSYGGERMQNGFHRLVRAKIVDLPYADLSGHDATAWLDANHYQVIGERGEDRDQGARPGT